MSDDVGSAKELRCCNERPLGLCNLAAGGPVREPWDEASSSLLASISQSHGGSLVRVVSQEQGKGKFKYVKHV